MAAVGRRRILACALHIYQKNRRKNMQRIEKMLSIALFLKRTRMILLQQCLNHLKTLIVIHHFNEKKSLRKPRSCRRLLRNQGWWETVRDNYDDNRFYETFRMSRTTFYHILGKISNQITKEFVTEEPIPADFRLAITIYKLSRDGYLFTIGEMCGLN